MKRHLDCPPGELPSFVVDRLLRHRVRGRATATGVRIVLTSGVQHDFRLRAGGEPLRRDEPVYLWWAAGGPVCAPVAEVRAAEAHPGGVADQIQRAREALAAARQTRAAQAGVDIVLA